MEKLGIYSRIYHLAKIHFHAGLHVYHLYITLEAFGKTLYSFTIEYLVLQGEQLGFLMRKTVPKLSLIHREKSDLAGISSLYLDRFLLLIAIIIQTDNHRKSWKSGKMWGFQCMNIGHIKTKRHEWDILPANRKLRKLVNILASESRIMIGVTL